MKTSYRNSIFYFLIVVFIGSSCNENNDNPELNDFEIIDVAGETQWDYWIVSNNDKSFLLIDSYNSMPEKVFFKPSQFHQGYPIFLDENGLPETAMIDGYTFLFSNFKGNTFDIAVVDYANGIQVFKDIESDYNFDSMKKSIGSVEGWHETLKFASIASSVAACGIGLILSPAGIGLAIAAIGCGATAAMIAVELMPDDQEILGLSASSVGGFATAIGCVQTGGITCALGVASEAATITDAYITMADENSDLISEANDLLSDTPNYLGDFAITSGTYDLTDDWTAAVKNELGSNYRPLEWNELKDYHNGGGDVLALFDELGLTEYGNSGWVLRNGSQTYSSSRGYFASRHEHDLPSNYLAHDNIDNYLISLGSWYGSRKVLALKK